METLNTDFEIIDSSITTESNNQQNIDDKSSVVKTTDVENVEKDTNPEVVTKPDVVEKGDDAPETIEYKEDVILKRIGETFKGKGIEIDIPEEIDADGFIDILTKSIISKEIENPESEITKDFIDKYAEKNGLDERTMAIATGVGYGIDRKEYVDLLNLRDFSDQEVDLADQNSLQDIFFTYHSLTGMTEENAKKYTNIDLTNVDQDLVSERLQSIYEFAEDGLAKIAETIKEREQKANEYNQKRIEKINGLYKSLTVDEHEFTKEEFDSYLEATSKKTEEIVYPNGMKVKVTPFDKKKFEFSDKNFEKALLQNMLFWLDKKDSKDLSRKDTEEKKVKGTFLKGLNDDLKKSAISDRSFNVNKVEADADIVDSTL